MEKAQYAIMRFAKYKGPEIGNIEAHNERTKEKYASNPDVSFLEKYPNFRPFLSLKELRAGCEQRLDHTDTVFPGTASGSGNLPL